MTDLEKTAVQGIYYLILYEIEEYGGEFEQLDFYTVDGYVYCDYKINIFGREVEVSLCAEIPEDKDIDVEDVVVGIDVGEGCYVTIEDFSSKIKYFWITLMGKMIRQ